MAAVAIRRIDQLVANRLRIAEVHDRVRDCVFRDHSRQAVAAQHQVVALLYRHLVQLDVDVRIPAQHTQQDVLLTVQRMIARQRLERVAAPEIRAAVADVRDTRDVV